MQPKVSVIIPVYNGEDYLVETLECALTQDLRDIEVICVDDGSTDRSAEIVRAIAEVDSRLRLVQQPNQGAGRARNRGIDEARGSFITFLDADDLYEEPTYLRALYEGATSNNVSVAAGCFVNWRGPNSYERDFEGTEYDGYTFAAPKVVAWTDFQFDYGFHRFLFDRALFAGGANRFSSLTYFEDPVFLVRVLDEAGTLFVTDQAHYLYRCGGPARFWTTRTVLDLLEGVARNLRFSRERGLARLHWYTIWHMEWPVWEMGIGPNPALAVDVIDAKLRQVEQLLDQDLLRDAGEQDLPFVPRLRKAIDSYYRVDPVGAAYRKLRYVMAHRS